MSKVRLTPPQKRALKFLSQDRALLYFSIVGIQMTTGYDDEEPQTLHIGTMFTLQRLGLIEPQEENSVALVYRISDKGRRALEENA